MTEHPIIFSGPMVRAILAGRKTQTRRIIVEQPARADVAPHCENGWWMWRRWLKEQDGAPSIRLGDRRCPYGQPGGRLWVRETWRPTGVCAGQWTSILYKADGEQLDRPYFFPNLANGGFRPSIHMPRAACRLVLEITGVRAERLQEISQADAKAEGVEPMTIADGGFVPVSGTDYIRPYKMLWDDLNAERGFAWSTNPWVWVVEFKRS